MRIFISYAHEDSASLLDIERALGIHEVWFDKRLHVGQVWQTEIEREIGASHCLLFLLSARSLASEWCQKELAIALQLGKPVAPVMIEQLDIPESLSRFQVISAVDGFTPDTTIQLLNGLFEIERQVFNPLRARRSGQKPSAKISMRDLYFATTNVRKKQMYERILNVELQTAPVQLQDIQHIDAAEIAMYKAQQAYDILKKPVFVDHAALAIRAWGGLPGGLATTFIKTAGLHNLCKMLQPFDDKYAEAISVIAFTDGQLMRKFTGVLVGEITEQPRGDGYSWNNTFIPKGFTKTLGEMTEDEINSIYSRRQAMIEFMRFLQSNYELV
ncbi:MAG: non-canonical purine NTP pyrophosphatase [Anaerolineae bacterium]